ncbi:Hypothetical predicted protein, partial [Olea europaea subsp. europaea]
LSLLNSFTEIRHVFRWQQEDTSDYYFPFPFGYVVVIPLFFPNIPFQYVECMHH